MAGKRISFWDRLLKWTDRSGDCWIWTGGNVRGYGYVKVDGKTYRAARLVYEIFVGPIPDGYQIDHLCRNVACVNPEHLEAVTPRENVLRGNTITAANAAKTHCPRGHLYDVVYGRRRYCRRCNAERSRRWQAKKRHD